MTIRITTALLAGLGIAAFGLVGTACGGSTPTVAPIPQSSVDDGFTQPPPSTAQPTPSPSVSAILNAKFGQPYALHVLDHYHDGFNPVYYTYDLTVGAPTATTSALSQYGSKPERGYYVTFYVTITAKSEGVEYDSMYFSVRETSSESHSCLTGEDTFGSGTLHNGQKAAGTVICDVSASHGTLVYDPMHVESAGSLVEWPF